MSFEVLTVVNVQIVAPWQRLFVLSKHSFSEHSDTSHANVWNTIPKMTSHSMLVHFLT
jgi:hypothetical protein